MADSHAAWTHRILGVALDMDGLMVNTEDLYTIVGQRILERRGRSFTMDLKRRMTGLPGNVAWQIMIDTENLSDSIETLEAESKQEFDKLLPDHLEPMPGLFELLDYLDTAQIPKCVATSSTHAFADRVLSQIGARSRVDFVITAEDVPRGKPYPDIYLEAAKRLGVGAQEILVLEDSQNGSLAGSAAGACTVAVPGDHSRDHDFRHVFQIASGLADPLIRGLLVSRS